MNQSGCKMYDLMLASFWINPTLIRRIEIMKDHDI